MHGCSRRGAPLHHALAALGQTLFDGLEQLLQCDGLFQEVHGADAGGLDGGLDGGMAGHHDDRHGELARCDPFLQQADAIGVRHPDVQQHQVHPGGRHGLACTLRVFSQRDDMPFVTKDLGEQLADAHLIVDYQNLSHFFSSKSNICQQRAYRSLPAVAAYRPADRCPVDHAPLKLSAFFTNFAKAIYV